MRDTAALVPSAARIINVENPDSDTGNAAVDSTQGEAQSALDVAVYCSLETRLLNANVESP